MATLETLCQFSDIWNRLLLPELSPIDVGQLIDISRTVRHRTNAYQTARGKYGTRPALQHATAKNVEGIRFYLKWWEQHLSIGDCRALCPVLVKDWSMVLLRKIVPTMSADLRHNLLKEAKAFRRAPLVTYLLCIKPGKLDLRQVKTIIATGAMNKTVREKLNSYKNDPGRLFTLMMWAVTHYNMKVVRCIYPGMLKNFDKIPNDTLQIALRDLLIVTTSPRNRYSWKDKERLGMSRINKWGQNYTEGWILLIPALANAVPELTPHTHALFLRWVTRHTNCMQHVADMPVFRMTTRKLRDLFANMPVIVNHLSCYDPAFIQFIEVEGDGGGRFARYYADTGHTIHLLKMILDNDPNSQKMEAVCTGLRLFPGHYRKRTIYVTQLLRTVYRDVEYQYDCITNVTSIIVFRHLLFERSIPVTQEYVDWLHQNGASPRILLEIERVKRAAFLLANVNVTDE